MGNDCGAFLLDNKPNDESKSDSDCNDEAYGFTGGGGKLGEDKCPVLYEYKGREFIRATVDGEKSEVEQIKSLSDLMKGNVFIEISSETHAQTNDYVQSTVRVLGCKKPLIEGKYAFRKTVDGEYSFHENHRYEVRLRSINSMLYFLGEVLRHAEINCAKDGLGRCKIPYESGANKTKPALVKVLRSSDCRPGSASSSIPLLHVYPRTRARRAIGDLEDSYAASVNHAGEWYYAVPKFEYDGNDNACDLDRSGTVFSILSQLFIRSQSKDFLKAPEASILRTQ